ncbi:MAG: AsmA-like C-terminal region-containing protein, partial [Gammaproteobacteria bacterium]|nr:AsmA-like C-terminal region-containing protein [Gammaproteobacteria bacterium]
MSAVWHHQLKPFQLQGAAVGFGGKSEPPLPKRGLLQVSGTLENVELKEWLQLREQLTTEGQDAPRLPIEVKMQRLHLMSSSGEVNGKPLRVKDTTPLSFHVDSFAYGDVPLGRVEFTLRPENTKLLFNDLNIKAPSFTAAGRGQWVEGENTSINLTLSSDDFGRMMRELGFASVVTGGEVSANGELFWPGSPASFSLSQLEGVVQVKIDDGRIEDVKPGAGKLLGLLSLQALPRRLFLDFSDLAEEGLQFTTIEGDIRLAGGDAFTQNLHIESLPANM